MSRRQRRREIQEEKSERSESPKHNKQAPKRRNRSSKRKKKASKGWWWKGLLGLFLLLIIGGFVVYNRAIAFLHSDEFREKVQLEVGAKMGCETEFGDFTWEGLSASNDSFEATGEGAIAQVNAEDITFDVDLDFVKRDKYVIENVKIGKVSTVVDLSKKFITFELEKEEKGFIEKLLPEETELVDVNVKNTNMRMITEGGDYVVTDTNLDLKHDAGEYVLNLSGGKIELPMNFINQGNLKNARLLVRDEQILISSSEYDIFEKGTLSLDGSVDLKKDAAQKYFLRGNMAGVELGEIIPKDWKQSLYGNVSSEFTVMPKEGNEPVIRGTVDIEDGVLRALPVLDTISYYLKNKDFQNIKFKEFRCKFEKYKKDLRITDVYAHSQGLLRIEGNLTIRDRELDGLFNVGVPPQYLAAIPGAKEIVFKPGKDRMHWAKIKITGTLDDIEEDLTDRMIAAAPLQIFRNALKMGGEVLGAEGLQKRSTTLSKFISENGGDIQGVMKKFLEGDPDVLKGAKKLFGTLLGGGSSEEGQPEGGPGGLLQQGGGLLENGLNLINPNNGGNRADPEEKPEEKLEEKPEEKKPEEEPEEPQSGRGLIDRLSPF